MAKERIYFISGHRNIKPEDFEKFYVPALEKAESNNNHKNLFVVGDYEGVDIMAQEWLRDNISDPSRVTVFHMHDKPRNLASKKFNTIGGFEDDISRDSAMTAISSVDIAFIRQGGWTSGTAQNILRRYERPL